MPGGTTIRHVHWRLVEWENLGLTREPGNEPLSVTSLLSAVQSGSRKEGKFDFGKLLRKICENYRRCFHFYDPYLQLHPHSTAGHMTGPVAAHR